VKYLKAVKDVCFFEDWQAVVALEAVEADDTEVTGISWDELSVVQTARKTVDKPNSHRLLEFSVNVLPYYKEAHLQAMQSICFNDWQKRAHSTGVNSAKAHLV